MSRKFFTNIDMAGNQLLNARVQYQSGSPTIKGVGQLYFDTGNSLLYVATASNAWTALTTGGTSVTTLNGLQGAVTVSGSAGHTVVATAGSTITVDLDPSVVFTASAQTLSNKTISGANNTITNIALSSLSASTITLGSTAVAIGATAASVAGLSLSTASVYSASLVGIQNNSGSIANGSIVNAAHIGGTLSGTLFNTGTLSGGTASALILSGSTTNTNNFIVSGSLSGVTISGAQNTFLSIPAYVLTSGSTVTIGSTAISLGGTAATLAGISSVSSTSFVGALFGNATTVTNGIYTTDTGTVTSTMILDGTILNADINATAAITPNKLSASAITIGGTAVGLGGTLSSLGVQYLSASTITLGTTAIGLGGTAASVAGFGLNSGSLIGTTINTGSISGGTLINNTLAGTITNTGTINGGSVVAGFVQSNGDIWVTGNLYLNGSSTYVSSSTMVVYDPLIYLSDTNPADAWDIGLFGAYVSGSHLHTGFVRDHTTKAWKLFSNASEPTDNTVSFGSVTYDSLHLGGLVVWSSSTTTSASLSSAGLFTAPSANITSNLLINGSAVATQTYVTTQGYSKKVSGSIQGTGAATTFNFSHNLNTQDVVVRVWQASVAPDSNYFLADVEVDILRNSASPTNVVTIGFAQPPGATEYYSVVVIG